MSTTKIAKKNGNPLAGKFKWCKSERIVSCPRNTEAVTTVRKAKALSANLSIQGKNIDFFFIAQRTRPTVVCMPHILFLILVHLSIWKLDMIYFTHVAVYLHLKPNYMFFYYYSSIYLKMKNIFFYIYDVLVSLYPIWSSILVLLSEWEIIYGKSKCIFRMKLKFLKLCKPLKITWIMSHFFIIFFTVQVFF